MLQQRPPPSHIHCLPSPTSSSPSRSTFPSFTTTSPTPSLLSLTRHTSLHAATTTASNPDAGAGAGASHSNSSSDETLLLSLLQSRETDKAYSLYSHLPHLPGPVCLSRLLAQLSYNAKDTPASLSRAKSLVRRLVSASELHRLDGNSLGLLASAAARAGDAEFAASVVRSMLRSGILPHVKAWTAAVSALAGNDVSTDALRLFRLVMRRIRRELDGNMVGSDSHMSSGNCLVSTSSQIKVYDIG